MMFYFLIVWERHRWNKSWYLLFHSSCLKNKDTNDAYATMNILTMQSVLTNIFRKSEIKEASQKSSS